MEQPLKASAAVFLHGLGVGRSCQLLKRSPLNLYCKLSSLGDLNSQTDEVQQL